ncbi:hypothetical protein K438DRAFT_1937807 [Mycena galopus ATCC 62051]|nr:hypothetical protein K438DRAFT_1937807 [Mycena galopus ATCC 62051]
MEIHCAVHSWLVGRFDPRFRHEFSARIFDQQNLKEFLDNWFARAGARPLSLYLEGGFRREEDDLPWPEKDIQRVVSTILTRLSPKIQVLSLHTDTKWYPHHSLDFPLLQDLSLDPLDIWGDLMDLPESIHLFSAAPQIQELFLTFIPPFLLAISWETLTVFTAEELSSKECVDVLRSAPSLVKCVLSSISLDPDTGAISHPNLKSFKFSTGDAEGDMFLQFLTFPALENLDIDMETVEHEHLLHFISRSSSALLKLTSRPVPSNSLSEMVALNNLHLFILSSDYLGEFFSLLNRTQNPSFLPQLQTLELSWCPPFLNASLVDALSSRHEGTQDGRARLRSFRQEWSRGAETNAFSVDYEGSVGLALAELTKQGMDIYIGVET